MAERKESVAELQARREVLERDATPLEAKSDGQSKAELRAIRAEMREVDSLIRLGEQEERTRQLEASNKVRLEVEAKQAVQDMVGLNLISIRDDKKQAEWEEKFIKDPSLIAMAVPVEARGRGTTNTSMVSGGARVTLNATAIEAASSAIPSQVSMSYAGIRQLDARNAEQQWGRYGLDAAGNRTIIGGGYSLQGAMKKYLDLQIANSKVKVYGLTASDRTNDYRQKGLIALEAATFYKRELAPRLDEWEHIPMIEIGRLIGLDASKAGPARPMLEAGDYSDSAGNLGVLSGTLVLQRTLPFFAADYPEIGMMTTDFADTPGVLNQAENTRIVVQQGIQKYTTTLGTDNRPLGWNTAVNGETVNVTLTLTDYIGVPINFSNAILGSTTRKLFDEQAVLAVKGIAAYFLQMVAGLFTAANYNAYSAVGYWNYSNGAYSISATPPSFTMPTGQTTANLPLNVPTAYPTYVKAPDSFTGASLNEISAAMDSQKVPSGDRFMMLNPTYFMKLRNDPLLWYMFMGTGVMDNAAAAANFLGKAQLPQRMVDFKPIKAQYMPASMGATSNIVGFAGQKAGIVLKSRLPNDFVTSLGVMVPGSVTTVTDPDTKISLMLVQYVNLTQNCAEWRPEVQLGVSVGDPRGGMVITSQ